MKTIRIVILMEGSTPDLVEQIIENELKNKNDDSKGFSDFLDNFSITQEGDQGQLVMTVKNVNEDRAMFIIREHLKPMSERIGIRFGERV